MAKNFPEFTESDIEALLVELDEVDAHEANRIHAELDEALLRGRDPGEVIHSEELADKELKLRMNKLAALILERKTIYSLFQGDKDKGRKLIAKKIVDLFGTSN